MTEDKEIIDLFFERSENAISELSEKYGEQCRSVSYRILNDMRDAEECVNDSYLAMWNTVPPKVPDPLKAYLLKIVRNLSLKKYRINTAKKRNSYFDASLDELGEIVSGTDAAYNELESRELLNNIEGFLNGISQENRVVFVRRYWFCNSYKEISQITGLSEKNVSVRLTRLRNQLKNYLNEREICV